MRATAFLFIALVVAAPRLAADQVTLKDGDRVTGNIVKMEDGKLTMDSAHFGAITVSWAEVDSIRTDSPVYVLVGGAAATPGTLSISGGRGDFAGRSVAAAEITGIRNAAEQREYQRRLAPGWMELWTGNANLAWAGAAGNARTSTFATGANAARETRTDKTSLHFSAIKGSARISGINQETAKAVRGGIGYDHNISPRLFINLFNDYEYDRFQDLDLRVSLGGGLGFTVLKDDRKRLDALAGIAYTRENFSSSPDRNSAEAYWGDEFSLKLDKATELSQSFRMFNNFSDTGNFRANFDLGSVTKLGRGFTWNLRFSDRYLHHPAPGRKTNDFLYATGLGFAFGS